MGRKKKGRSTSLFVTTVTHGTGNIRTAKANLSQIRAERLEQEEARELHLQRLTSAARQTLVEARLELGIPTDNNLYDDTHNKNSITQWPDSDDTGDEDSHEDRLLCTETSRDGHAMDDAQHEIFQKYYHPIKSSKRRAKRTRLARNRAMFAEWDAQLPALVKAYLEWKDSSQTCTPGVLGGSNVVEASPRSPPPPIHHFDVTVVDIKERVVQCRIPQRPNELAGVALIRAGVLGCSPMDPSVAITLECLELYHQIRRRQSSFSLQAICKVLCAIHNVTYYPTFRTQFSIAFDLYLAIIRHVCQQVDCALGRDDADWRLLHACPPCGYKLQEEPMLVPARLHAMDGNFSLKRVDGSGHTDERVFASNYLIPPTEVDNFKDDVRTKPGVSREHVPASQAENAKNTCTENWKAAHAISEETTEVFDQTGGFISVCRHGLIETLVEMRKSGELAKYGLATLDRLLRVFKDDQGVGCDIACSFAATVRDSSISERARIQRLLLVLNAFHGYAHGRQCMLRCHPLYLAGLGLEDLETCERVFSSSNSAARLVRHASYFHWLQFLDLHFQQWDDDKYLELSRFLYNNYQQALSIIAEFTPIVESFKAEHMYDADIFTQWNREELEWLSSRTKEPEADILRIAYVEALERLSLASVAWGRISTVAWQGYTPADLAPTGGTLTPREQSQLNARESERRAVLRKLDLALNVADDLERQLGLSSRWMPEDPEYMQALAYINNRTFVRAVETLEGLVVARLFELAKANLTNTGYKMRKHISKAITRRSAALHTALDKYNALAPSQSPPRPHLDYADMAGYGWLGDFELLKHSRRDILDKPWTVAANREVAVKHFKVIRAHEEIVRLNVEIRRLHTWVNNEDRWVKDKARELEATDPLLASRVWSFYAVRHRINNVHRARLQGIFMLSGYTGHCTPGVAVSSMPIDEIVSEAGEAGDVEVEARHELEQMADIDIVEDDMANDEALRFGEFLETSFQIG